MRKTILTALIAATLLPVATAASAASPGELRHDRREIREQQRDVREARRRGDYRDVREERRDVREARQEYREDLADRNRNWGRDDWRGYRDRNGSLYARGRWNAPFRYTAFRPGLRIASGYYGPRYVIADPRRYRLPRAGWGQQWVRHYDDVILVDTRRGVVVQALRGFYR